MGDEWFILFVPILLSLVALWIFKHKLTILETLLPTGVGIILIMVMKLIMVSNLTDDTEYFSGYVVSATYYEDWNEYIHETCTEEVSCGEDCTTTNTYDCSYVDYNWEYWEVKLNTGRTINISEEYFNQLVALFGNKTFIDMDRDYYTNDGDAYQTVFDGVYEKLQVFDWSGKYSNKPQTNETIFHFEALEENELSGVVEYPTEKNWERVACIGCSPEDNESLRKLNGLYGMKKQIHVYIIQTEGQGIDLSERQRRHWKNGNKNELVIVVDKDGKWAKSFSWVDDKGVEAQTNHLFQRTDIPLSQKIQLLSKIIDKHWVRKEFKDFDYIHVNLTSKHKTWIFFVVFFASAVCLVWGVANEQDCDF